VGFRNSRLMWHTNNYAKLTMQNCTCMCLDLLFRVLIYLLSHKFEPILQKIGCGYRLDLSSRE
jgi:hypothetical protein